ncbi:MAG: DUF3105 domain-containing protein [Trueperaceae bacterium]
MSEKPSNTTPENGRSTTARPDTTRPRGMNPLFIVVPVTLAVVGILYLMTLQRNAGVIEGVETTTFEGGQHQEGSIAYDQDPPMGGVHHASWMNCGIYDTQVEIEKAVHSLEHGAVWIAYQPDLASDQVDVLKEAVSGRKYTLLAPYMYVPMDAPIIAVAWGARLELEDANDPRLAKFLQKYVNGPQVPEPGALCSNGVGTPLE